MRSGGQGFDLQQPPSADGGFRWSRRRDLALLTDLARRAGEVGPLEWLSFFFKSPQTAPGHAAVNDLFLQHANLHRQLRRYAAAHVAANAGGSDASVDPNMTIPPNERPVLKRRPRKP